MEQRLLRLGDVVDDYCPRERRIANHVIVAIVEDQIRQTRCTTCDAEHVYKHGKAPRRKKKDPTSELFDEVLAEITGVQLVAGRAPESASELPGDPPPAPPGAAASSEAAASHGTPAAHDPQVPAATGPEVHATASTEAGVDGEAEPTGLPDGWLAHRRLIRARLPKIEGELPPPRPIPEFTMHQPPPPPLRRHAFRSGFARPGHAPSGNSNGNGNTMHGHGNGNGAGRRDQGRPGADRGNGQPGQPRRHRGRGKRPR